MTHAQMQAQALENLRTMLVGATVVAVDDPDSGKDECFFKLTVERGTTRTQFHVHGTDMGWWTSGESEVKSGRKVYTNVQEVLDEVTDHAVYTLGVAGMGPEAIEPVEDVMSRMLGFRCKKTGRDWWFRISAAKQSPWGHDLLTPGMRAAFAQKLGDGLVPNPSPREMAVVA